MRWLCAGMRRVCVSMCGHVREAMCAVVASLRNGFSAGMASLRVDAGSFSGGLAFLGR